MNVIFFICCYFRTQPFEVKQSLYPVVEYLSGESIHMFPIEKCPYCKKQALKEDPEVRKRNHTLFKNPVYTRNRNSNSFQEGQITEKHFENITCTVEFQLS